MKLGLLVPSIMSNSLTGFYNLQEMGLIKAFDKLGVEAIAYRLVDEKKEYEELKFPGTENAVEYFLPSMRIGTNGMVDLKLIDKSIDALICFTDTQLDIPRIYRWARLNNIPFYSYVGVVESHSNKSLKRFLMNIISQRNTKVHKASVCFVKTPYVGELLKNKGVRDIVEAPVGLDEETLKRDYASYDRDELRSRYGYEKSDKIILFVGRLEEEKRPLDMMRIFKRLLEKDPDFRLLMVGKGSLENEVIKEAESLKDKIKLIDALPNSEMWRLYRLSDVFVNLNKGEIFGMSILEAMYYECKVVAFHAPGPDHIIENKKNGYLAGSDEEIRELTCREGEALGRAAHKRIEEEFLWSKTAVKILDTIKAEKQKGPGT